MSTAPEKLCRKCGTMNPAENAYCRKCGVVMSISTGLIRAQRKPLMLRSKGIRWRWVPLGALIMLGTAALGTVGGAALGLRPILGGDAKAALLGSAISTVVLFFVAFFIGGLLLSRLCGRPAFPEALAASVLAVLLLGMVGSVLATDLVIAAGLVLLPSAGAAWLGAYAGGIGRGAERTE